LSSGNVKNVYEIKNLSISNKSFITYNSADRKKKAKEQGIAAKNKKQEDEHPVILRRTKTRQIFKVKKL
jgi:hypothetical protein